MPQTSKAAPSKRTAPAKKAAVKKAAPAPRAVEPEVPPAVEAPEPPPTASPARRGWLTPLAVVMLVAVVLGVVLVGALGAEERGGPPHTFANLSNGTPATLYVPGKMDGHNFPLQPPKGQRPPVVIVAHGFSADQAIMSTISRSLAKAGYAVVSIDFRGHGSNTHSFNGDLYDDLESAVDYAMHSPYVDNTRIALLGHSMGASAVLEAASRDARIKAVVPVSGGDTIDDAVVPQNVLLIAGQNDPKDIRDRQKDMESLLTGKTKVERVVVSGKNHVTILFSNSMMKSTVSWLDGAFGVTRAKPAGIKDPRVGTAALYLLVALVLMFGVGVGAARLAPPVAREVGRAADGGWGILIVAIGSLVAMPLLGFGPAAGFLPQIVGPEQFGMYAVIALLLYGARRLGVRRLAEGDRWLPDNFWPTLGAAAVGFVGLYLLMLPFGTVFHRLVPTPERFVIWIIGTAMMAPLFLATETLVRRGSLRTAIGLGIGSRVMAFAVLYIGIVIGVLPGVLMLVLPILALLFVISEIFAAGVYWQTRNVWLIALVEAGFIALIAATSGPVF
jgi:dienelactone hydrolase